ncbi:MAG: hypothetical protein Q4C89_04420 [Deinococcus sp.]|uniref:hypothetical protein n=1 Tax=Deinococcus sp. TaxID=47478 RepID=UPI0026DC5C73|nr:hypothetical protein [Deinococcus sp.]MDO4245245.1 hypothetical protein [Deinococcus sp.]
MKKRMLLACALTWAGANAAGYEMKSYVALDGKKQEAFAWCDAPDRVLALTQVREKPTKPQPATLVTWLKGRSGGPNRDTIQLGAGEGAAGSVFYAISGPGQKLPPNDYVRLSNIENVQDPSYRMSRVVSFRLAHKDYSCRYVKDATFIGVTQKRTVIIWNNGKAVTYATRNFDGSAGVYVTGGTVEHDDTGPVYLFETSSGYSYIVTYDQRANFVQVLRGNKVQSTEHFLAYSSSSPKP